jgi:hypothetical protein
MSNHQLVHHQSNFTTWSMLLSWHCQEIWSSTVTMLIILLKSLTRISQFMTLCWWFYFQIGLSICDLILQFMLMILLGSSVWGFYDLVAHFGWWFCLSHVWGFFMILLRNLCWWFHLSWVQGFYDPILCPFMLMIFLESGKNFMILLYNLCWWFCLRWVWGFYDLNAQFMLMVLLESSARILWSWCTIYVHDFASILWGFYNLVVQLMLMIFCLSLVRILWSHWVQLMLMICLNLALEINELVVCEFMLMMFVAQGSFQGQLQKFLRRQMLIGNLSIMSPCLISRSTWSRWHLIPYQLDFKPEYDFIMSIDFNLMVFT